MRRGALAWRVLSALVSAAALSCASTQLEIDAAHPASHAAEASPLPPVGAALEPKFDPLLEAPAGDDEAAAAWTCPMHPEIVKPEPGNCPICGMKLQPVQPKGSPEADPSDHTGHSHGAGH